MKLLYRLLFTGLLVVGISGCLLDSKDNPTETADTPLVGAVYVGDEAYRAIGCGYDIFGNYADPAQIKGRVIEAYNLPDEWTKKTNINHTIFTTEAGQSIEEYQQRLSVGIDISGKYLAFSGAVKTNFSSDYYGVTNTSFATVMGKINKYQIIIQPNYARASLLRPYMTDQAAKDLEDPTVNPELIFMMYGTHVMMGAMMGARLDFSVTMRTSNIATNSSIDVYAEAEYSSVFAKVNSTAQFKTEAERKSYEENRKRTIIAIGGDSELSLDILTKDDYSKWINSITGNEVFCDYTENGLVPIWEFCDSDVRKEEIAASFETWASNRQIVVREYKVPEECILDIHVKNLDVGDAYDSNGLRYYKINQDLNEGAGGKFIYIYTAHGMDTSTNPMPITNVALLHGTTEAKAKNARPTGHTIIDCDLNEGAEGEYLYLCFSRSTEAGNSPLRGLQLWDRDDKDSQYSFHAPFTGYYNIKPYPNATEPYDLNRGSGGDYIYLLYSQDVKQ